jgi:hypothetical protein
MDHKRYRETMTPRERVFLTLQHHIPDRIPKFEIYVRARAIYTHLGQDCVMMPSCQPAGSNTWKTGVDEFGRRWHECSFIGGAVDSIQSLRRYSPSPLYANDFFREPCINRVKQDFPDTRALIVRPISFSEGTQRIERTL